MHVSPAARVRGARVRARDRGEDATRTTGRRPPPRRRRWRWRPPPTDPTGWLAPAPHYAKSPLWDEDANEKDRSDDDARDVSDDDDEGAVVVGDVRLPSAPAEHPATRPRVQTRPDQVGDVALSISRPRGLRVGQARGRAARPTRARGTRSWWRERARGSAGDGDDFEGTKPASDADYFERLHLERAQRRGSRRARNGTRCVDTTSGWRNRVTEPVGPTLGVRPAGEIQSLAPAVHAAAPSASLSNSLSNVRLGGLGGATRGFEGYYAVVASGGARRAVGPPGWSDAPGRTRRMSPTSAEEEGASRGDWRTVRRVRRAVTGVFGANRV